MDKPRKTRELGFMQLRKAAVIYMALPVFCYLAGFLRWYYAVVSCAALLFVLWKTLKGKDTQKSLNEDSFRISLKTVIIVFLFSMLWSYLGGMNGHYYQSSDWDCRNAVFFDLIRFDWPVIYERNGSALVYYIGHWLPSAAIAKIFQSLTGSAETAREIGRQLLWLWSGIGLTIIILMIFRVVRAQTRKKRIFAVLLFVFFSGLDILGAVIRNTTGDVFAPDHLHLEWWMRGFQYTSIMACLFWVFNQAIIPWMITLCFFTEDEPRNYVFYATACLLCGTLPCIGLVMLMIAKAVIYGIKKLKQRDGKQLRRTVFSIQNIITLVLIFPMIAAYLLSANTFKDVFGDKLRLPIAAAAAEAEESEEYLFDYEPEILEEDLEELGYTENADSTENSGEETVQQPESPRYKVFFLPYKIWGLFLFVALEVGLYMLCVWPDHWKEPLFYVIAVCFFIIPFIHIGRSYDFCMRASLPMIFIVMLYVNRFLLEHFHIKRNDKSPKEKGKKLRKNLAIVLVVCFAVGMATPGLELYRGIRQVAISGTIELENRTLMTFDQDWIQNSYACSNPDEHLFFRYLSR